MQNNKSVKLFIDESLIPTEGWTILRSLEESKEYIISNGVPRLMDIGFHLLAEDYESKSKYTGYDLIKWLIQSDIDGEINIPSDFTYKVHAHNNLEAEEKMLATLRDYLDYRDAPMM
jgi:hypothetical protein